MSNTRFLKILFITIAVCGSHAASASELDETYVLERVGFHIGGLKIYHQSDWRNMTIAIEYEGEVRDVGQVKHFVKEFLQDYSNMKDFWEVMNVNLVYSLIQKFPEIKVMESKFSLEPDTSLFFPRESTVIYREGESVLRESFGFTKLNYLICNETFKSLDMFVHFDLKENPVPSDYPDYQWVDQAMVEFFKLHPVSSSNWSEIKPLLEAYLLEQFPSLATITVVVKEAK